MAMQNQAFELEEIDVGVESENGINLEKIVWEMSKELHHKTMKEKDDSTTHQSEISQECEDCKHLATAHHVNMGNLKIRHKKPTYPSEWKPDEPTSVELFESTYTNQTSKKQLFSFKTRKQTTSSATVELERPVLYGREGCKLRLQIPECVSRETPVFGNRLEPSKCSEEFKQEMEWSVDNLIDCPPKKTTKASFLVSEQKYAAKFSIETTVSGKVIVVLNEENEKKPRYIDLDIAKVIGWYENKEQQGFFRVDGKKVVYTTKGMCKFNYGVEQYVTVAPVDETGCCTIL